jgi:cation-transporting ATPase E
MSAANRSGLTSAEVAHRVALGQVNRVQRSDLAEYRDIAVRNVLTLFNAMVVPAALALFFLDAVKDALAVSGFALTNTLLGLIQEIRAKRHLEQLALLAEGRARVVRDGQVVEVRSGDVVKDDVLLLSAGDSVLADGAILEARFLEVDEALLTGESDPVPRHPGDRVLSGSFCVAGEGAYRADRVGAESFAQKTTREARSYRYTPSPMQQSINRLIQILTGATVALCGLYLFLYLLRGKEVMPLAELVKMIAATITSMVPQGLVLMATLAFILGAVRMSRHGALVQRLNAVESMASINTLCMDKTGTLTTNQLRLQRIVPLSPHFAEEEVRERLRWFASASLDRDNKSLAAIRAEVGEIPVEVIDLLPFKSQNRYSAVRVQHDQGRPALVLGAVEALRDRLDPGTWEVAEPIWRQLLSTGLRLLLFGEAEETNRTDQGERPFNGSLEGFSLRPLALLALSDELRPAAREVLRLLAEQGIEFKILSGDNPDTVRATVAPLAEGAEEPALQALTKQPVVTGAELESAGEGAEELIHSRAVFGRVSPWQKVQIIHALKQKQRKVAMIGDGVNDVLPIKDAHLGIAMGEGSRASKTVSGLVLETNDFGLLPQTLDEGRTITHNLRRAAKLFLTKNVFTPILILGAIVGFRLPFPFLPRDVTLLNALTIGLPALLITLGREKGSANRTACAVPLQTRTFLGEVGRFVLRTGGIIGLAGLLLLLLTDRLFGRDVRLEQTMLVTALVTLGLATVHRLVRSGDSWFYPLLVGDVLVFLVLMYVPSLSLNYFELKPLGLEHWGLLAAVVVPAAALLYLTRRMTR